MSLVNPQAPQAELESVRIVGLQPGIVDLMAGLRLENPNLFTLKTSSIDLDLTVADVSLARLESDQDFSIKPRHSRVVELPLTVRFSDAAELIGRLENETTINYTVTGTVVTKVPLLGPVTLPVSYQGALPVPKMPRIIIRDIDLQQFNLSDIRFTLEVEITNPNNFAIELEQTSYSLQSHQQVLARSQLPKLSLDTGEQRRIKIPVHLSTGQFGKQLLQVLTNFESLVLNLQGQSTIQSPAPNWSTNTFQFSSSTSP